MTIDIVPLYGTTPVQKETTQKTGHATGWSNLTSHLADTDHKQQHMHTHTDATSTVHR